jgi:hypothetical protein
MLFLITGPALIAGFFKPGPAAWKNLINRMSP